MMKKDVDIGPIMAMMRSAYRLVKIAPFAYDKVSGRASAFRRGVCQYNLAFFSRIVPNSWRKK